MSWRNVVVSTRAKLDLQMNSMVVRAEATTKINISEISVLIIENTSVSLTAALLCELIQNKVKVIFCDGQRNPSSELVAYYGCHDCSSKVKQQIRWDEVQKGEIWRLIVREKITAQKKLLELVNKYDAAKKLEQYINEIEFKDQTNREGHAAKVYFNALFGMDFTRADDNNINAALNYGYSLFLSLVNREITINGYLTQLGVFHDNIYNNFNLGSDLMEPFRPIVDEAVYNMQPKKFEHEEKLKLIELLNNTVEIENSTQYIVNAVKIYSKSIFDALNASDMSLVRFFKK